MDKLNCPFVYSGQVRFRESAFHLNFQGENEIIFEIVDITVWILEIVFQKVEVPI